MKRNKSALLAFGLLILSASLYRAWDGRPFGFAPQMAMAIFAGAVIKDKRLAFVLPLLSMLISDALYQMLYVKGLSSIPGFYSGQWVNYLLICGLTAFGFLMKKVTALRVLGFTISGSLIYFLTSNFSVWLGGGGLQRPKTGAGLLMCYGDGLAFYRDYGLIHGFVGNILLGDIFFSALLFGSFALLVRLLFQPEKKLA
jgi:hypothetical protein